MTPWIVLAGLAVFAYLGHRTLDFLALRWKNDRLDARKWHEDAHELAKREVHVKERDIALREKATQKPERSPKMPDDLNGRIMRWEDIFAQEAERQTITDLYAEYEDWDLVRQHLAPVSLATVEEFIG